MKQKKEKHPKADVKKVPAGPGLKVGQFVDLMRRLDTQKGNLTDDQARFVQSALQRFEHESTGTVKTKLSVPKPKKKKAQPRLAASMMSEIVRDPTAPASDFIDRLVKAADENAVLAAVQNLSDAEAEQLAHEQGFRAAGPQIAREKLAETIMHLRQIERIAGAGRRAPDTGESVPK